jgi:hypothetical protein
MNADMSGRDQLETTTAAFNKIMDKETVERTEKSSRLRLLRLALETGDRVSVQGERHQARTGSQRR